MTDQLGLFSTPPKLLRLPAAAADPSTSVESAVRAIASGRVRAGVAAVVAGVTAHPGKTSRELAAAIGMDRVECARRLADAKELRRVVQGEKRKCQIGQVTCVTWELASQGG